MVFMVIEEFYTCGTSFIVRSCWFIVTAVVSGQQVPCSC